MSGHRLANQGWKDSGDSIRWQDGRIAEGPIAPCEVQAYAYEAAVKGAQLLEAFGRGSARLPGAKIAWDAAMTPWITSSMRPTACSGSG